MPVEQIDTLVIGGGQAGLTMSHRLKQRGLCISCWSVIGSPNAGAANAGTG